MKARKKGASGIGDAGRAFEPGWAWIEALGPNTKRIVQQHLYESGASSLFGPSEHGALKKLADALSEGWHDDRAGQGRHGLL